MNIFVPFADPVESAKFLDDSRVIKMTLETAQILSTALQDRDSDGLLYKPTHRNHPVVIWTVERAEHLAYTISVFDALANEYAFRFGKIHKSYAMLRSYIGKIAGIGVQDRPDFFCNCTEFKDIDDVHEAYRLTLQAKWSADKRRPKWTNRDNLIGDL